MAKATVKAGKAKATPDAVKAQGAKNMPKADETGAALIPVLKSKALSLDVGPRVIKTVAAYSMDKRQVEELKQSMERKSYDALASITASVVKAALADDGIKLDAVFSTDKMAKVKLNNQLYCAMGFKTVLTVGKEGAEKKRVEWASDVGQYVKPEKDDPTDLSNQKGTVRTNLAHMLTKCIHAALHIIENKVDMKTDKASGTLRLTGPAIKSHFGEASVVLNEKQTVAVPAGKKGETKEVTLKAKPSFTEIARLAATAHGKTHAPRVDSRAVSQDPNKHVAGLCEMLVKALEKLSKPNDTAIKALESARSAIDKVLD